MTLQPEQDDAKRNGLLGHVPLCGGVSQYRAGSASGNYAPSQGLVPWGRPTGRHVWYAASSSVLRDKEIGHRLDPISAVSYTGSVPWDVHLWKDVDEWFLDLDPESSDLVAAAIDQLAEEGPNLGRPLVDKISGSRHHNMKELRPGSAGKSEVRILFAFDLKRRAILLVAGDKSGQWSRWYRESIPVADDRFDEWQEEAKKEEP